MGAGLRQSRRDRHAGRRRPARRREPRHRQARARDAVEGPAQGRAARAARRQQPDRQDHRQLPHRVHAGAAHQRRRPDEHARHRRASAAGRRRGDGRRGPGPGRAARDREHRGAGPRSRTSSPRRGRSWRRDPEIGARSVLVVAGEGWHRGVIGIVASKLVDHFYRPAIVLSRGGRRRARLVPQHSGLRHARRAGVLRADAGAASAATSRRRACRLESGRIREFRLAVNAHADERLGPDDLRPRLYLDGPLAFGAHHRSRRRRAQHAGAVRPVEPAAEVLHRAGRSGRRPAPPEGAAL